MTASYYRDITLYLYEVSKTDPMRHVPHYEIYQCVQPEWIEDSFANDFTASIRYLVGKGYVEEEAAHYRLTSVGLEYAISLLYPTPDYPRKSFEAQNIANIIAVISAAVAILGLIALYIQSHPTIPSAGLRSIPIPLTVAISQAGFNAQTSSLEGWFDQTPTNPSFEGVNFLLSQDSSVIETESQNSANPNRIFIPIQQNNVATIHLLLNLSYANPTYTNGMQIYGTDIVKVSITSGDKEQYYWLLKAGTDIREWVVGSRSAVNTVNNHVKPIWQALHNQSGSSAVIDHIALAIPDEFRNQHLNYIIIEDRSAEVLSSQNPGIMIFGITVEVK